MSTSDATRQGVVDANGNPMTIGDDDDDDEAQEARDAAAAVALVDAHEREEATLETASTMRRYSIGGSVCAQALLAAQQAEWRSAVRTSLVVVDIISTRCSQRPRVTSSDDADDDAMRGAASASGDRRTRRRTDSRSVVNDRRFVFREC